MHWGSKFLLLFWLVYHSGTPPVGNTYLPVTGIKGGSVTLPCEFEDGEISDISLNTLSKDIPVCQTEECSGRVFKEGSCDIIIKDLIFSDAGKYFLIVYYYNDQREVRREILQYHLHLHGEISVKTGEQLKMDVLLINADKVEKNSSGEWTEVWTRGHGVSSDRLTDRDGNLTISNFTVSDTGTYRVLDSEGEIWITVTVTESRTESKGKLDNTSDIKLKGTEQSKYGIMIVGLTVCVALVVLALITISVIKRQRFLNRKAEHVLYQGVPMLSPVKGAQRT